ncbi:hypothetical protein DL765_008000 [Monosporascus sp. GIB2]|nr:hypothetical protein DL765_008000 [Monosporascus sp. GIB2]
MGGAPRRGTARRAQEEGEGRNGTVLAFLGFLAFLCELPSFTRSQVAKLFGSGEAGKIRRCAGPPKSGSAVR